MTQPADLPFSDTLANAQSAAAPAINTNLASIANAPHGVYELEVTVILTGTAETQLVNLGLRANNTQITPILTITGQLNRVIFRRVTVTADSNPIELRVLANATAGSIYNVSIRATRLDD